METILKLKSDGAQAVLTVALLAGCALNLAFVAAFMAVRSDAAGIASPSMAGEGAAPVAEVRSAPGVTVVRFRADAPVARATNRRGSVEDLGSPVPPA